jgi:hypothetical protein
MSFLLILFVSFLHSMKKIIAFLLLSFVVQSHIAQNYTPFPETTAVWDINIQYGEPTDPSIQDYIRYTMEGDTLINGLSYNKIYCSHYTLIYPHPVQVKMTKLGYCFGIRQDISNKKVYRTYTSNNITIDTLFYDFNLKVGDTVPLTSTTPSFTSRQTVESVDSISFQGKKYRRFKLKTIGLFGASLIEGIGNGNGLIEHHSGCFEGCYILSGFCDTEYHDCKKQLVLYTKEEQKDDGLQFFPNPFTTELTIQFKDDDIHREVVITDILGHEIHRLHHNGRQLILPRSDLKSGIFFLKVVDRTGIYIRKLIAN